MDKCQKLLQKARRSPQNLRFDELCRLAECYGWVLIRQSGSHRLYENVRLAPEDRRMMNFQSDNGKAKPYQVKQLLTAIENL